MLHIWCLISICTADAAALWATQKNPKNTSMKFLQSINFNVNQSQWCPIWDENGLQSHQTCRISPGRCEPTCHTDTKGTNNTLLQYLWWWYHRISVVSVVVKWFPYDTMYPEVCGQKAQFWSNKLPRIAAKRSGARTELKLNQLSFTYWSNSRVMFMLVC